MIGRLFGTVTTIVLVIAAVGLAAWLGYSAATGATLIAFRTGSMSPTMPQGAIAVTVPVPASELEVGDVVTVQRAGEETPVTHRVVEIGPALIGEATAVDIRAAAPGSGPPDLSSPEARRIVMQGDDNDTPDHLPYALEDARRVVFALPHAGAALMTAQTPIGMGALILTAGVLVVWAFWPRTPRELEEPAAGGTAAIGADPAALGSDPAPRVAGIADPAPRAADPVARARHAEGARR